ncbi:hypothetical protein, partial [Burkholderia cepacia]
VDPATGVALPVDGVVARPLDVDIPPLSHFRLRFPRQLQQEGRPNAGSVRNCMRIMTGCAHLW